MIRLVFVTPTLPRAPERLAIELDGRIERLIDFDPEGETRSLALAIRDALDIVQERRALAGGPP